MKDEGRPVPSPLLLHLCMVLVGLATALLGPILPLLSRHWLLQDQQSGLLLLAQFCGSFTGGMTVSKHLRRSLILGFAAGAVGFVVFAFAPGLPVACVALYVGGWGCGQIITAGNIIAGRRYGARRGSALALLNFAFSFGAMLSPLLAAWLTPRFALPNLIGNFAGCFAVVLFVALIEMRGASPDPESGAEILVANGLAPMGGLAAPAYLYFAALLFFYGGIETSLNGWLTTYALRYGDRTLVLSQNITFIFWASLTVGHGLSSLLLLRLAESRLQRAGLTCSALFILGLATAHGGVTIAVFSILLGLSLAPFFPTTFSQLMGRRPSARQAGVVLAMSGLGAAAIPSLMGILSTHAGSLQVALSIPLMAAIVLLLLSLSPPAPAAPLQT